VEQHNVAACFEDQVLVGTGDFHGDGDASTPGGYWESYVCGPAVDDFSATNGLTLVPDTSMMAPVSGGLGESLAMVLIVGAMALTAWRHRKN
jgi:hypothetical protein